jgi:hypothetical protein
VDLQGAAKTRIIANTTLVLVMTDFATTRDRKTSGKGVERQVGSAIDPMFHLSEGCQPEDTFALHPRKKYQ